MPTDVLRLILDRHGTPPVWSVLVTMFGDFLPEVSDQIDGPVLSRLAEGVGIKPEATRVALHRLRLDGWIVSHKSGRTARHGLSGFGRRETQRVYARVYAALDDLPDGWVLAVTESAASAENAALTETGFTQIAPRSFVGHNALDVPSNVLCTPGTTVPDWLLAQICSPAISNEFRALDQTLRNVSQALSVSQMSRQDLAVIRCLLVHFWRRLVLRHPFLPASFTGADWSAHRCRQTFRDVLDQIPRPNLTELK